MTWVKAVGILLLVGGAAKLLWEVLVRPARDDVARFIFRVRNERARLEQANADLEQAKFVRFPRDDHGLLGAVAFKNGEETVRIVDLDLAISLYQRGEINMAATATPANRTRLALAALPVGGSGKAVEMLESHQEDVTDAMWPNPVTPEMVSDGDGFSLDHIPLGINVARDAASGEVVRRIIRDRMSNLVHVIVAGATRWGKSTFLQWLAYVFLHCKEDLELVFIDISSNTFDGFYDCARRRYPIAETREQGIAVLAALVEEMERRRGLYQSFRGERVYDLPKYNRRAQRDDKELLSPIIVLFDEAPAYFQDDAARKMLTSLVQQAGKFGVWFIVAGTNFRFSTVPTTARENFITRMVAFMSNTLSRPLLGEAITEALRVRGRMWVRIPGASDLVQVQTPLLADRHYSDLPKGAAYFPMPETGNVIEARRPEWRTEENRQQLVEAKENGASTTAACQEVLGVSGGRKWTWAKEVLSEDA